MNALKGFFNKTLLNLKNLYPELLIPNKNQGIVILSSQDLDNFICRFIEPNVPIYNSNSQLNIDEFSIVFTNCSFNCLIFSDLEHVKFKILKPKFLKKWTPYKRGMRPWFWQYEFIESRNAFMIKISHLHKLDINIPTNKLNNDILKNFNITRDTTKNLNIQLALEHEPLNCNYSHFELKAKEVVSGEPLVGLDKSSWKVKNITEVIKSVLKKNATFSNLNYKSSQ